MQLLGVSFLYPSVSHGNNMNLIEMNLPTPKALRPGWAALAAVLASRGWKSVIYATSNQWQYHDGGGNWVVLRKIDKDKILMFGYDHENRGTYFREAAEYFEEEETDLLLDTPEWWSQDVWTTHFENWVGFIYGWDGLNWKRAVYDKEDGFNSVGLIRSCCDDPIDTIKEYAAAAPGLKGEQPNESAIKDLIAADGKLTHELLNSVVPGWDIEAGVLAGRKFLDMEL